MDRATEKNMQKNLPVQAAPVQRVLHTTAPGAAQGGVEASKWIDYCKTLPGLSRSLCMMNA